MRLSLIFYAVGFFWNCTVGTGIWAKYRLPGNGIWRKFGLGNRIETLLPPSGPSRKQLRFAGFVLLVWKTFLQCTLYILCWKLFKTLLVIGSFWKRAGKQWNKNQWTNNSFTTHGLSVYTHNCSFVWLNCYNICLFSLSQI